MLDTAFIHIASVRVTFTDTENPPENTIFPPAAARVPAMAFSYTKNSSFRYRGKTVSGPNPKGVVAGNGF